MTSQYRLIDRLLRFLPLGTHEVGSGARLPVLILRIARPGEFYLSTFEEVYEASEQMMKTWFTIDGTLDPLEYEGPSFFRFPAELAERVLMRYSSAGDWAFDPFCGFGTTLVVAQRSGRQAVGFEKEADRARFVTERITAPTRVINHSILHLSQYALPRFPILFTGIPYTTFREWNTDGFTHLM